MYVVLSFFNMSKSARISISSSRIGCSRGSDGRLNNGVAVIVAEYGEIEARIDRYAVFGVFYFSSIFNVCWMFGLGVVWLLNGLVEAHGVPYLDEGRRERGSDN